MHLHTNELVEVRLTPAGKEMYLDWLRMNSPTSTEDVAEEATQSFQLWKLMQIFGPHMGIGRTSPFEDDIVRIPDTGTSLIRSSFNLLKDEFVTKKTTAVGQVILLGWEKSREDPVETELVSELFMKSLIDWLDEPDLVREVLRFVGRPICTCDPSLQWCAAARFVGHGYLYSVSKEAALALGRLNKQSPEVGERVAPNWKSKVRSFVAERPVSASTSPELQELSIALA